MNKSIIITPEQTLVNGKPTTPDSINIVLENGHTFDIDSVIDLLTKWDKKHGKKTSLLTRTRLGLKAFKAALKETDQQAK